MNRLLPDTATLVGRQLVHLRRVPSKLMRATVLPVVTVVVFGYLLGNAITVPGGDYREYVMAGIFTQVMLAGVSTTAVGVHLDARTGIIDRFRSWPVSPAAILLGRTVADVVVAALACAVMSAVGLLIGWRPHGGPASVAAGYGLLLATGFALSWLGVLIGLSLRSVEAVASATVLVTVPFTFLSNALIPLDGLPPWLAAVAEWNPVTAVIAALHELWGNAPPRPTGALPSLHPIPVALAALAVSLALVVPAARRAFHRSAG